MENYSRKILALKYRPQTFGELIGQDVIRDTIINAIKSKKIPNAYLLTGIRGVGKTTTARIIAKALNCKKNFIQNEKCNENEHCHCEEISRSNHLDVLEVDAASKTGIDDIRELIESSKYVPASAKYKIFIIDEVHMLSKQAFNGLLKTLEEPPPHLKFIFATTEVKKIPVTIISRCQRFDLNRISINLLFENLKKITKIEKGNISDQGLKLIAKTAEGSVRDSLSLLDRVLATQSILETEVNEDLVQKMLGIADKSRIIKLLKFIIDGDEKSAIRDLRIMINGGVEPKNILNDLLETIYFMSIIKNLGSLEDDPSITEEEHRLLSELSKKIDSSSLIIFWQFILRSLEELNIVNNQILSIEMFIIRLIHLKDMPNYEEIMNLSFKSNNESKIGNLQKKQSIEINPIIKKDGTTTDQIKNISQERPKISPKDIVKTKMQSENLNDINSFEELIERTTKEKEIELKYDLVRNVSLVNFSQGQIDISFNENLKKDFIRDLSDKLLKWTGKRWIITLTQKKGQKTFKEQMIENEKKLLEKEKNNDTYKNFLEAFPDAELVEVESEN